MVPVDDCLPLLQRTGKPSESPGKSAIGMVSVTACTTRRLSYKSVVNWMQQMELYKEAERICRQIGMFDGLRLNVTQQAEVLRKRGDMNTAMDLYKEAERICRQLGKLDSLRVNLGVQALILEKSGQLDAALALHREKEQISIARTAAKH
jgi:hypothetical protein